MRRLTSASVASSGLEQCCGALLVLRTLPFMCFPSTSPLASSGLPKLFSNWRSLHWQEDRIYAFPSFVEPELCKT